MRHRLAKKILKRWHERVRAAVRDGRPCDRQDDRTRTAVKVCLPLDHVGQCPGDAWPHAPTTNGHSLAVVRDSRVFAIRIGCRADAEAMVRAG